MAKLSSRQQAQQQVGQQAKQQVSLAQARSELMQLMQAIESANIPYFAKQQYLKTLQRTWGQNAERIMRTVQQIRSEISPFISQPTTPTSAPSPAAVINPLINLFAMQQLLAERGVERAYQQAVGATLSQLRRRGLETSGITSGALMNLGEQFASNLADIRARTAQSLAEAQLRAFENLLNIAAQREATALQAAAAGARDVGPLLQQASSQLAGAVGALANLVGVGFLPSPFGTPSSISVPLPTSPAPTMILPPNWDLRRV